MIPSPLRLRVRRVPGVISTDDIIPARYKHMFVEPSHMAKHVFENLLPEFASTLQPGDALCANDTFGIGSSREQAVSSLLATGVRAVFAPRFGRIFFRNAWNLGLIAIQLPELMVEEGGVVDLYVANGRIAGAFGEVSFTPPASAMLEMVAEGGLLAMVRKRMKSGALAA
jgi:3-isopropylmalate/(R)-2-methylmalate dehydratase small subunit